MPAVIVHKTEWPVHLAKNCRLQDAFARKADAAASVQGAEQAAIVQPDTVEYKADYYTWHALLLWRDTQTHNYSVWEVYDHACADDYCCRAFDHVYTAPSKAEVRAAADTVPAELWDAYEAAITTTRQHGSG